MLSRFLLLVALAASPGFAQAQYPLEIVQLRHRPAQEVLPILQPLAEPGATLTGQGYQLFVRASPANVAELRRALAAIDTQARRLQLSVRFEDAAESERRRLGASGSIGSAGARIQVDADERARREAGRVDQRVQVLDGGRALISTGASRMLPQRQVIRTPGGGVIAQETVVVQQRATGFEVVPRVSGNSVRMEIAPQREAGDQFQRVSTSVTARLGEWFEIGGVDSASTRDERGIASASGRASSERRSVWLMVEELP